MINFVILLTLVLSVVFSLKFATEIASGAKYEYCAISPRSLNNYQRLTMNMYGKRTSYTGKKFFICMTIIYIALIVL